MIGVLALQGDFDKHLKALRRIGVEAFEVRTPQQLRQASGLIIPGGESTTVGKLMIRYGLDTAIRERTGEGMAVWGTCMGMITMAQRIEGSDQPNLGLLDITVRRNAFGRQVDSFEASVSFAPIGDTVIGVFIRAPIVTETGAGVEVLSTFDEKIVCVRQSNLLGTSFHPELTGDLRIHRYFAAMAGEPGQSTQPDGPSTGP